MFRVQYSPRKKREGRRRLQGLLPRDACEARINPKTTILDRWGAKRWGFGSFALGDMTLHRLGCWHTKPEHGSDQLDNNKPDPGQGCVVIVPLDTKGIVSVRLRDTVGK
jgi:hypothetical protein